MAEPLKRWLIGARGSRSPMAEPFKQRAAKSSTGDLRMKQVAHG